MLTKLPSTPQISLSVIDSPCVMFARASVELFTSIMPCVPLPYIKEPPPPPSLAIFYVLPMHSGRGPFRPSCIIEHMLWVPVNMVSHFCTFGALRYMSRMKTSSICNLLKRQDLDYTSTLAQNPCVFFFVY